MTHPPFVPVGLPRDASPDDSTDQRVGLHLLEALDSLDAVYKSAAFFAGVASEAAIGDYTLSRCLESVHAEEGALLAWDGTRLTAQVTRGEAAGFLATETLAEGDNARRAMFHNGGDAVALLAPGAARRNVLTCPIQVGEQLFGMVVALAPSDCPFSTADAKLASAVVSQAAIAFGRARSHQEAERERQKLREVVANHPDGIVVLDAAGTTLLQNPIAEQLCRTDDVLRRLHEQLPGATAASLCAGSGEHELVLGAASAQRFVQMKASAIGNGDVVLTLRDLTQKRREDRLKQNFVSLLSHKLRTPLTAIVCAVDLLPHMPPEQHEECLDEMRRRSGDLEAMISRLFAFTELLEGSWSTQGQCDLGALRNDWQHQPPPGTERLQIEWDVAAGAETVPVPAARLRVALTNLLENVAKFAAAEEPWAKVEVRRFADRVRIAVEDHGPGIPVEERAELFEAGHQIDMDFTGNVAGVGIGLAMVREITTRLGGRLSLEDAAPHGCRFVMTFPLDPGASK